MSLLAYFANSLDRLLHYRDLNFTYFFFFFYFDLVIYLFLLLFLYITKTVYAFGALHFLLFGI